MRLALLAWGSLVFLGALGCSTPRSTGGGDDGAETGEATGDATGDTTGGDTTGGDTTGGDTTGDTGDTGEPETTNEWTVDPHIPDVVGGKTMHAFNGYQDAEGLRLYFCGKGGIMRIREGTTWRNQDLSVSETIRDCDVANDDLMAAVADQGRVWKWQGTENWQSFDLLLEAANLRGVAIESLGVLRVVGVSGTIQRLDTATWVDEGIEGLDATLEDIIHIDGQHFAVGDQALLHHDGEAWAQDELPEDAPGTPPANQGFSAKGVWAASHDAVWAVGGGGKIAFRGADGTWAFQDSQWYGGTPFNAVWGFNDQDVFAVGAVGKARRWNGTEWTVMEVKTPKKTKFNDPWPSDQVVPPEGAGVTYIGAFAKDPLNIWLFTGEGLLIQYNDDYQL